MLSGIHFQARQSHFTLVDRDLSQIDPEPEGPFVFRMLCSLVVNLYTEPKVFVAFNIFFLNNRGKI